MNEILITKYKDLIGEGGNWIVYRCNVEPNTHSVILKVSKGFTELSVLNNLQNYKTVLSLGLPTLTFLEQMQFECKPALISEDLNLGENFIFVSPNSLVSDSHKRLSEITKLLVNIEISKKECVAEQFRYKNKLTEILCFEEFIKTVKKDLDVVSRSKVLLDFDSYFFGTQKNSSISEISYKIADFDNIGFHESENTQKLMELNMSEFARAILSFLHYFVVDNENREIYAKFISREFP